MTAGRVLAGIVLAATLATYGYRAVTGLLASMAFERGHLLRNTGEYGAAAPDLERAAEGALRMRALRMAAETRIDIWEVHVRRYGGPGADRRHLRAAAQMLLECRCVAPASPTSWSGLANVYDSLEWVGRERRSVTPLQPAGSPWERIGRQGRISIGLARGAIERYPNWFRLHDWLAITLWSYGLEDAAREVVAESARVLPVYHRHKYTRVDELPPWFAETFAAASREAVGQEQVFPRMGHLVSLGKLERMIGANDRAIAAFTEALELGGDEIGRAEAHFYLGLARLDEQRPDEGRAHLELAAEHRRFRSPALRSLAALAEREGRLEQALDLLRHLRWEQPRRLAPCLDFARVARRLGDWPAAEEALLWAKLIHPDDPRPYEALVDAYIEQGNLAAARAMVNELAEVAEAQATVEGLRRRIAAAGLVSRD